MGLDIDYESEEELYALAVFADQAKEYVERFRWAPPVRDVLLAFGVSPILALYLVRFTRPIAGEGDTEQWVVVGDLPTMCFETDDAPDPVAALRLYCAIAQDWADNVTANRDLSDSYPIPAPATLENAKLLYSRIKFIETELIPSARHA